ncbi:MAG: dipeptidase [Bacteroidales bacterium]|nr:dipeptidase [Bacteroidales bacterium]
MRGYFFILISFLATLVSYPSRAQELIYPVEIKAVFEKSDAEISEATHSGQSYRHSERGEESFRPTIAVPNCPHSDHLKEMIRLAGGYPVDVPAMTTMDNPYVALWTMASGWDGAAIPDGWVRKDDEYSVLFYKAVAERNIPYVGSSPLMRSIDNGLRRMPGKITNMEDLVRSARIYKKAKELMDSYFTIDTHCDLPDLYQSGYSVGKRSRNLAGVPKMEEGHLDAQILISFLWQGPLDNNSSGKAVEKNLAKIAKIKEDVEKYPEICGLAKTPAEADSLRSLGKKAFLIALENGYGIGNDLGNIKKMRDLGVVYISLCHFRDNAICNTSSRHGSDPSKGLTEFGKKVVEEMNRQGILIDLSHPSAGTFWDCIRYSKAPIICSHSGAKAVYGHDRGLDDKQLKALAENGGVIQIYSVPEFIGRPRGSMTIDDMMAHFDHCVEVAGAEHVGIGSDFDGGGGVWDCNGDNDLINLTVKMIERGYSPEQIKGFWGGNFMRVWKEALAKADRD